MKIALNDLKKLCEKILEKAEKSGFKEIDIDADSYWDIDDMCDFKVENPTIIIGSFMDDWNSLEKVLSNENPATIVDFDRLGNVIKILGDVIYKSDKIY